MISKFNGTCRYCKLPTKAGQDEYDLDTKTSYHELCKEAEEQSAPSPERFALAERLGFRTTAEWDLLLLPPAAHGDPTFWDRCTARGRDTVPEVPASAEGTE